MKIFIEKTNKKLEKKFSGTVAELLNLLKLNSETVLVTKNNTLVSENEAVKDSDEIKILSVISGG